jgi:hypothetical protein
VPPADAPPVAVATVLDVEGVDDAEAPPQAARARPPIESAAMRAPDERSRCRTIRGSGEEGTLRTYPANLDGPLRRAKSSRAGLADATNGPTVECAVLIVRADTYVASRRQRTDRGDG